MTRKKPLTNDALENFITGSASKEQVTNPWEGLDPNGKRTGNRSFTIQLNDFEWAVIEEAAKKEGSPKAALIRQAAIKKSRTILGIQ